MQQKIRISPSILSADFARLGEEVEKVTNAGADFIHIDVMDGHFVPNISFGPSLIKAIRSYSELMFDVHLMISPVDRYIESYAMAGADIISFHPEAELHVLKTLQLIKSFNKKTGLALNPATSPDVIDYLMDFLDVIIVMTVNPGFGRQQFLSTQLRKIEAIRKKIDNSGCDIQLEVDGGITLQNAKKIISAGATILVAGTAVFSGDYQRNIEALRKAS